ncbi:hypothetical protein [Dyella subtropica]|uniref:hypothetical protein n=1 Tax=Dyella subtropica TaxID=2992127 RepID=UPI00224CFDCD|nr:hypothetical protein [Dyella subtropica]
MCRHPPRSHWALLALACALSGCEPGRAPPSAEAPTAPPRATFDGHYAHGTQRLDITRNDGGYWLNFVGTGANACAFQGTGMLIGDQLQVSLQAWKAGALLTVRHAPSDSVDVLSEQEDDRFSLTYFCHGGEALSGNYRRLPSPAPSH